MCFASGSIFGNKFLTPEGIKTLFPIFENSCWKHELAGKHRSTSSNKLFKAFILCLKPFKLSTMVWKNCVNVYCVATSGLRVWWAGFPFCFLEEVANSHPSFSQPLFATNFSLLSKREATPPALWRGVSDLPRLLCVKKVCASVCARFAERRLEFFPPI